jgi:SulP family sulfate permease
MDHGLEKIEDELLSLSGFVIGHSIRDSHTGMIPRNAMTSAEMDLRRILADEFSPSDLDILISYCETIKPIPQKPLFQRGSPGDSLFFIERGELTVMLPLGDGRTKRLRSFGPGTIVGEMGVYAGQARSADVVASENCRVRKLSQEALARLEIERPEVAIKFHRFVAKLLALRLTAANTEIRTLS